MLIQAMLQGCKNSQPQPVLLWSKTAVRDTLHTMGNLMITCYSRIYIEAFRNISIVHVGSAMALEGFDGKVWLICFHKPKQEKL